MPVPGELAFQTATGSSKRPRPLSFLQIQSCRVDLHPILIQIERIFAFRYDPPSCRYLVSNQLLAVNWMVTFSVQLAGHFEMQINMEGVVGDGLASGVVSFG